MKIVISIGFSIITLFLTSCKNNCSCEKESDIGIVQTEKIKSMDHEFIESLLYRHEHKSLAIITELKENNQIDKEIPTERVVSGQNYWTPLCFASFIGNKSIVRSLIENGANIKYRDKNGNTPLILAALGGNIEELDLLIQSGADINEVDNDNCSSLMNASAEGNLKTVEYLVGKGCLLYPKNGGLNALDYAIFYEHTDVIEYLVSIGMKKGRLT